MAVQDKVTIVPQIKQLSYLVGGAFTVITGMFWYGLTVGSWKDEVNRNGCAEFDLRPKLLTGAVYAPDKRVVTKYSAGFVLLNRATFDHVVFRNNTRNVEGVSTFWINPFTLSMTLYYKNQIVNGKVISGHSENEGINFKWQNTKCPSLPL